MRSLLLCVLLCPAFVALMRRLPLARTLVFHLPAFQRAAAVFAVLLVALPVAGGLYAASTGRIVFHDEATVLAITAAFWHGQPLYPAASAPVEYGLLYGPATYFAYLPPLILGATRIEAYQAWVVAALALTLLVFYFTFRPTVGSLAAAGGTALLSLFVDFTNTSEWAIKGDIWILFFSAAALFAALRLPRWSSASLVALFGAVLIDLKATLLFAAILPVVLLWERSREYRLPAIVSTALIPVLTLAPFAAPGISLREYVAQLLIAGRHGFSLRLLAGNLVFSATMLLPMMALVWFFAKDCGAALAAWFKRRRTYLALAVVALAVAVSTGSKNGAGPWHCMAMAVPVAFVTTEIWQAGSVVGERGAPIFADYRIGALFAIVLVLVFSATRRLETGLEERYKAAPGFAAASIPELEDDLIAIISQYPGVRMQMGYSDTPHYDFTFVRPLLQIYGSPLFIDADARNEGDLEGRGVSAPVMAAMSDCEIGLWVLPHGGQPFSMDSLYYLDHTISLRDLYPTSFRLAFLEHYRRIPSPVRSFDLWRCK